MAPSPARGGGDDEVVTRRILREELDRFVTRDDLKQELSKYPTKDDLKQELSKYPTREDLKAELAKLDTKFATKDDLDVWVAETYRQFQRIDARFDRLEAAFAAFPNEIARQINAAYERSHANTLALIEQLAKRSDLDAHVSNASVHRAARKRRT